MSRDDDERVHPNVRDEAWLTQGGNMGELIRTMDWSRTALGPMERWPQSLRTAVSLCLASDVPISIAWGAKHTQIYNDGYWRICGGKHPHAMGESFRECSASAWPVIGEAFERALAGQTSCLEDQRMFLDRNGYLEETFFTFSFSPIRDELGVAGLFHPVFETTGRMLGERRTGALRDLSTRASKARTSDEAAAMIEQCLAELAFDLPYVLLYMLDADGKSAGLVARTGLPADTPLSAKSVMIASSSVWPFAQVVSSNRAQPVTGLRERLEAMNWSGPYAEAPDMAWALPLSLPGSENAVGLVIAGVSSRLPLSESYRGFYNLLVSGIASALTNARACEEARAGEESAVDGLAAGTDDYLAKPFSARELKARGRTHIEFARLQSQWASELERANRELEAFSYSVSHDLRAPLRAIDGFSKVLLTRHSQQLDPAGRAYLDRVRAATTRMASLIDDLLHLARISRCDMRRETVDLHALANSVFAELQQRDKNRQVTLEVESDLTVHADSRLLQILLESLLGNAWKFTSKLPRAHVQVGRVLDDGVPAFFVRDDGAGFEATYVGKLFKPFQRLHHQAEFEGNGIGLATVQRIVARHGGRAWAQGELDRGATFFFTLASGLK